MTVIPTVYTYHSHHVQLTPDQGMSETQTFATLGANEEERGSSWFS